MVKTQNKQNNQVFSVQISSEGLKALHDELHELKNVKLPAILERIGKAREDGDLSENSAYIFGKQEQEFTEGRISELEDIIQNSVIIQSTSSKTGIVDVGCKVTVTANGKKVAFTIVGEWEAKPAEMKISSSSPLGKALMGKRKGEKVEVDAPAGKVIYQIETVE